MDKSDWQGGQGDSWAEEWRRTDRSFGAVTENLLSRLRDLEFSEVLDIGCGAGELSLAIARGHPDSAVTGVDISPRLVATARERGANLTNAEFLCDDAAIWRPQKGKSPQLLVSRHGVMFFDHPVAAFKNLFALADEGANLVFSCFRDPSLNAFASDVTALLPKPTEPRDPKAPGPFAFADADYVASILDRAGWSDCSLRPIDFPMITGAGEDPIADAISYFTRIGPAARAVAQLDGKELEEFQAGLADIASRNCQDGIVSLPAAAWIVTAQKT